MAPPRRRPAQKRATFSSPASMAQAQRAAEAKSMGALQKRREDTRKEFFKGRPDISPSRLDKRQIQADLYQQFKQDPTKTKLVSGTTNLYQAAQPGGMTLADKAQELAFKYGPTPREIAGDIGYGIRSIGSALGQKVMAGEFGLLGIAKGLYEQFTNRATQAKDALVKGVNKLSDIDLEILKNKDQYKFLSKKPEIQEVENLQKTQMTEFDKANIIRQNIERVSTPITDKDNTVQSAKVFQGPSLTTYPGQGYLTGAGLPAIANQEDNYIKIQNGQAVPISKEEFLEDQRVVEEDFANDPFFADKMTKTSNQMNIAPGFEIVTDYKSPEARMQELIEQNKVNNTNMFDLGINKAKNQLSDLERIFNVDMR